MNAESQPRYVEPTRSTRIFNSAVGRLTRMGVSVYGSRVLAVRGRKSGEWRTTPVNPLTIDGQRYLISPRGNTQWVRNMRVTGGGELRIGADLPAGGQVVVGRSFIADGGFTRLNKVFGGELEAVLAGINEEMWKRTG